MRPLIRLFLWIGLIFLSACGAAPEPTLGVLPTLAAFPTATNTAIPSETSTATETLTSTSSPTASPTASHTATMTSSPTEAITASQTPSATITSTVTPSATITETKIPIPTNTAIPSITPTSERDLIGQEIALFTVLIEVFDPPIQYRALAEIDSQACANGACRIVEEFQAGQLIDVTGLACNINGGNIWYRVYYEGFFGLGAEDAFISQTALGVDRTMEAVDGIDYAARYSCP